MSPLSGTNPSIFMATTFNKLQRIKSSVWWIVHVIGTFVVSSDTFSIYKRPFLCSTPDRFLRLVTGISKLHLDDFVIWIVILLGLHYNTFGMVSLVHLNTLKPRHNGHHLDNDISNEFCWIKIFILQKLVSNGPVDNKSAIQTMAWPWAVNKLLSQPRMSQFTDIYVCYSTSMC